MASMSDPGLRTILISGGAGFIGSAFVMQMLASHSNLRIINVDALTYAGNLENLQSIENDPRHVFVHAEIQNTELMHRLCEQYAVEGIINIAAESHVDRSIHNASPFIDSSSRFEAQKVCASLDRRSVWYFGTRLERFIYRINTFGTKFAVFFIKSFG
jgi:UDP-glucose 4-epimerase